jgi:hypothetical protein
MPEGINNSKIIRFQTEELLLSVYITVDYWVLQYVNSDPDS